MKKIYGELTEKYDVLSSWEERLDTEVNFFKRLFTENDVESVLDCACGTGRHVIALHKVGFNVVGSDIDPYMIKQARENAKSRNVPVRFKVSDFKNLNTNFNTTFDAVLCTGNSLSHVLKDKEVQKSVHEMYKMLDQEGILILHLKNYQKLLKKTTEIFCTQE